MEDIRATRTVEEVGAVIAEHHIGELIAEQVDRRRRTIVEHGKRLG
ncbi:MAG: hypothetical protein QM775_28600 [Pirellulales bacterium]